ncbi:dynein regulatory complex protein 10 [Esox lucius]|uniref:Dynein regulatory complex protein 10 n=1 Tax=Esox lucius TaxID=8010 RepID=A0A3P8Y5E6_ESOLU|nr:dynein regulatory complex protein 10 [Esox lucius]XP_019908415.2 dynein regulatory complex protein 10 [Esox lucius]
MSEKAAVLSLGDVTPLMCSSAQPSPQPQARPLLKILDPSQKKLASLETQRIAGVLDNCIAKVEMVAMLPAVLERLGGLSFELGVELEGALQEHKCLGQRLGGLGQKLVKEEEGEAGERGREELKRAIQSSLRNILRLLTAHAAAAHALRSEAEVGVQDVGEGVQGLITGLQELRGVLLEKLLTSLAEEHERTRYMQELSLCHGNNMELVATLETEVTAAIKDRDAEIFKENEVVRKLKDSLEQMKTISEDFVLRTQQDADKQRQSDAKTSEGKRICLLQEANQLRLQLNNLIAENHQGEIALRKKKYKVETEIENWIQKYDADMGEKQRELEELTEVYKEEKEELRELEEAYAVLEQEFSQVQEERHADEARREEEQKELVRRSHATTVIQAFWRGHRIRKSMRGKGKKGSKGKKGKGKKGK